MMVEKNPVKRDCPVGSFGRKKRKELERLSQQTRLTQSQPDISTFDVYNMFDTEPVDSDAEVEDLTSKFSKIEKKFTRSEGSRRRGERSY